MRKKELKLVVTFHTTADAMAMEKACQELHVPGQTYPCSERNLGRDAGLPGVRLSKLRRGWRVL